MTPVKAISSRSGLRRIAGLAAAALWLVLAFWLNARLAPIRAAEYPVPILRVARSGISQLVRFDGSVAGRTAIQSKCSAPSSTGC